MIYIYTCIYIYMYLYMYIYIYMHFVLLIFAFKVREESHLDEQIFHSLTQVMTVCCIDS